jgi:YHS domain-containing protein
MLRTIITEFVLPLLLFLVIRNLMKGFFASPAKERPTGDDQVRVSQGGELKKDPVCGTYVSTSASVSRMVRGEAVYFCSAECRDRFKS